MLNALPDQRASDEINTEVFLAPNENIHENEANMDKQMEATHVIHEIVDLSGKRRSINLIEQLTPVPEDSRSESTPTRRVWTNLLAECIAELFGTAILVLFGCSGLAQYTLSRGVLASFLSVNFAFGLGAMIAVYVSGPISGNIRR